MTSQTSRAEFAIPAHAHLAEKILSLLKEQELKPGDKLPSERDLSGRLGVGYQQTRQALLLLGREHHLERRVGSGTYLRSALESLEASLNRWLQQRPAGREALRVGMILVAAQDLFLTRLIEELHRMAAARSIELLIRMADPTYLGLSRAARALACDGCGAILLPQLTGLPTADIIRFTFDSGLPVSIPRKIVGLEGNFFETEKDYGVYDRCLIRLGIAYMLEIGRRNLAYFGPHPSTGDGAAERIESFAVCTGERNLPVRFALLAKNRIDAPLRNWRNEGAPDAVCCYDDNHAVRLLSFLQREGWKIPGEISVIGINDSALAAHSHPRLTSIHFDCAYIASGLLDHALSRIGSAPPTLHQEKELGLTIRDSCGGAGTRSDRKLSRRLAASCGMPVKLTYA